MNVVCILLDTLRRDHVGCYGNPAIHTPNLDRFAANGAMFQNAYLGSYPCMPARQDLWTGRLNFLWRGWSPLEVDEEDLITTINRSGKTSMLVTDHYHLWQNGAGNYHNHFSGMEWIRGQEMDNWRTDRTAAVDYPASPEKLNANWERYARNTSSFQSEEDYFAAKVFRKSMDWIERNKDDQDFFLMIDCFDPHEPFDPPPSYIERYAPNYRGEAIIWPKYGDVSQYTEEELAYIHALYCAEVTFVDHWFGKFHDRLEALGMLENTMVIVTSDHGFLFGEHQWLGKHARILYQDIAQVPLLVRHPAIPPNTKYSELVQMPDLTPTILDALGIERSGTMHGASLTPLWDRSQASPAEEREPIRERESMIFGVFGGPVYCTDGAWLLVKKPNPTNAPLYWYTHSHFQNWGFGQVNLLEDSKDRFEMWDKHRFPVQYEQGKPNHAPPRMIRSEEERWTEVADAGDELYHIRDDHLQSFNRIDEEPEIAERLKESIRRRLKTLGAPSEQSVRLGL